jgi:putative membrane protein
MKLQQLGLTLSLGMVAFLFGGAAQGDDSKPGADSAEVLSKLHHSNQMEVAAGKLAQEKGQSKDVKSFGKMLVTDHSAADKKVMQLAKDKKIDLSATPPMPPEKMDKLKSASGADFDREFASDMLDDHKKDIAEVREARDGTSDAKLKSLLVTTLPVLEKHRDTAQKLVDKLGPSASATGANVTPTDTK